MCAGGVASELGPGEVVKSRGHIREQPHRASSSSPPPRMRRSTRVTASSPSCLARPGLGPQAFTSVSSRHGPHPRPPCPPSPRRGRPAPTAALHTPTGHSPHPHLQPPCPPSRIC